MDSGSPIIKGAVGVRGREAGITGDQGQEGLHGGTSARLSRRGGPSLPFRGAPKTRPSGEMIYGVSHPGFFGGEGDRLKGEDY
jgi:hypothetical protein